MLYTCKKLIVSIWRDTVEYPCLLFFLRLCARSNVFEMMYNALKRLIRANTI